VTLAEPAWQSRSDEAYRIATSYSWDDATVAFESALRSVASEALPPEVSVEKIARA
jgi:hypothetical protein